jgi:hypothetical protein
VRSRDQSAIRHRSALRERRIPFGSFHFQRSRPKCLSTLASMGDSDDARAQLIEHECVDSSGGPVNEPRTRRVVTLDADF